MRGIGSLLHPVRLYLLLLVCVLMAAFSALAYADGPGHADGALPEILEHARFDQRLNEQVPLNLTFRDESGKTVTLADYFDGKPVILTMNYYECPNLCPLVIDGLAVGLVGVPFTIGEQFDVVSVSINPHDTPELASEVKNRVLRRPKPPRGAQEWHFLTGDQASIERLARTVGFNYAYDAEAQQYAHPSGIMVLTPTGMIARYIYGIEFAPMDLRLALVEASENKIASPVDHVLLFCYRYDPTVGKYSAVAINSLRLAAFATLLGLGLLIAVLIRREGNASGRTTETVG